MSDAISVVEFRKLFPIFQELVSEGHPLVYLDNSATTQRPQVVIDAIVDFYTHYNSNVSRGVYDASARATLAYERCRQKIAHWIHANQPEEVVFTRSATEAINLVASSWGRHYLFPGDEILIGAAEHHSNYLPWQQLSQERGLVRKIIPLKETGDIDEAAYENSFTEKTRLVVIQHISNVLGSINPIERLTEIAHAHGAKIMIDGACSLLHERINVRTIDCDFFACSGHKGYGPFGGGFLYGKYNLLDKMPPYQTGGNTPVHVAFDRTTYKRPPDRFEAGTPDVAAVIGMEAAIDFLAEYSTPAMSAHFKALVDYTQMQLQNVEGLHLYGNPMKKAGIFAFNLVGIHAHDVATFLGHYGIAVRAGTHCAQPLAAALGIPGSVRVSLAWYNTPQEVDFLVDQLNRCRREFLK